MRKTKIEIIRKQIAEIDLKLVCYRELERELVAEQARIIADLPPVESLDEHLIEDSEPQTERWVCRR